MDNPAPLSDPLLEPFLQSSFDPVQYLDSVLPIISGTSPIQSSNAPNSNYSTLPDASARAQTLLSQLSAQSARLSSLLTSETDELLRHGPRLAFEVDSFADEVAKLSAIFLSPKSQSRTDPSLLDCVTAFDVLDQLSVKQPHSKSTPVSDGNDSRNGSQAQKLLQDKPQSGSGPAGESQLDYLTTLKSLSLARSRLDGVVRLFGEATRWPAPSYNYSKRMGVTIDPFATGGFDDDEEVSSSDPFIHALRIEIALCSPDLVSVASRTAAQGTAEFAAAQERLTALKVLARLWSGTIEEKIRNKVVDDLSRLAFDDSRRREREILRKSRGMISKPPFLEHLVDIVKGLEDVDFKI